MKKWIFLLFASSVVFARTYSTTFNYTETPISDGGKWTSGSATGDGQWGDVYTNGTLAYGFGLPTPFGDPSASVNGSWGDLTSASATVHIVTTPTACCHEVEVRLRTAITAGSITGYELLCPVHTSPGYGFQVVRWNGPNGQYVYLNTGSAHQCVDGDVLNGTISGTNPVNITFSLNGVPVVTACDNGGSGSGGTCGGHGYSGPGGAAGPFTTGGPGVGTFDDHDTNYSDFGLSSFSATDGLPDSSGFSSALTGNFKVSGQSSFK